MHRKTKFDAFLLVEGSDDKHVVWSLCEFHKVEESFEVSTPSQKNAKADGIDALLGLFEDLLDSDDKRVIGVVVDADTDLEKRWESIKNTLNHSGYDYEIPEVIPQNGLILDSSSSDAPRIGVWLMPNNQIKGELEDFVRFLIPEGDELEPFAEKILAEIEAEGLHRYANKRSKAFIHTWLAWQKHSGSPMGLAITQKALSADSEIALSFVHWLNTLFNS